MKKATEAVRAVWENIPTEGISLTDLARKLDRAKGPTWRAVNIAIEQGWVINEVSKPGVKAVLKRAKALPPRDTPPPKKSKDDPGYIYFLQCSLTGRVKIGWSRRPKKRVKTLQCGSPTKLKLVELRNGTAKDEAFLHKLYADYRLHGEWFESDVLKRGIYLSA